MKNVDPKLAPGWRAGTVLDRLQRRGKADIIDFLRKRHKERFFKPVKYLLDAPRSEYGYGYGFAVMALCSLLIETIQSYWDGLPSTHQGELNELRKHKTPPEYSVPENSEWPQTGAEVFKRFFDNPLFAPLFPDIDYLQFYRNIRNGLLHQAQTKGGWRLEKEGSLWDNMERTVNRTLFAQRVEDAFDKYIEALEKRDWEDDLWKKARRKIWWLVEFSTTTGGAVPVR
jgi:hypothetical protein